MRRIVCEEEGRSIGDEAALFGIARRSVETSWNGHAIVPRDGGDVDLSGIAVAEKREVPYAA
jgi:hypothetical protein